MGICFVLLCTFSMAQQKPMIKSVASPIKSGEVFEVTGTGFTPNRAAISHLIRPDKTEYNPLRLRANSSGEIVHKIDTVMLDLGTFELWIDDEASRTTSNRIQFTVVANPH
jgi:hypothetical protein